MSDLQHNIQKLDGYLARFKDTGILNQIGGEALPALSGDVFETRSPVDESLICPVARGGAADIDAAARAARAGQARACCGCPSGRPARPDGLRHSFHALPTEPDAKVAPGTPTVD